MDERQATTLPPLPLAVVGCDFRIASARWRSRLVLSDRNRETLLKELMDQNAADGLAELATCNRNEWIISSWQPTWGAELLRRWMLERLAVDDRIVEPYLHVGEEAARHLFRVALGRESLVVGERQIASQLFKALEGARERGHSTRILNGLGTLAGRVVRGGDRLGCRINAAKGVHGLALRLLQQRLAGKGRVRVAVIGLGAIGRHLRDILAQQDRFDLLCCNRTPVRDVAARPWADLGAVLEAVDAAVVCTGAPRPVIDSELLARAGRLLVLDLGIPEQVATMAASAGVERVGLDDLVALRPGAQSRGEAEVEDLIARAVTQLRTYCHETDFLEILEAVQNRNQKLLGDDLQEIVRDHFADLSADVRGRLAVDLRRILGSYTHEVFGDIKQAVRRYSIADPDED